MIKTAVSSHADPRHAVDEAWEALVHGLGGRPDLVLLQCSSGYVLDEVHRALAPRLGPSVFQGATSCRGALSEAGGPLVAGQGLGLWGLRDSAGSFGVGTSQLGADPSGAAAAALSDAIAAAGRTGEVPSLVWLSSTPGVEEMILDGLATVVGHRVQLSGGSAADEWVEGRWRILTREGVVSDAVSVVVFYPSCKVATSFHSGYAPTEHRGIVTRASGRTLFEVDGSPAALIYDQWAGGPLQGVLSTEGLILDRTAFHPLGRARGEVSGTTVHLLTHPARVHGDGSVSLFAAIHEGEEVTLMAGTPASLMTRAARVVDSARQRGGIVEVIGGLLTFCGGCMLAIEDRMDEVARLTGDAFDGAPFLTRFTFGEQGRLLEDSNRHGNLMISAVVFGT